MAYKEKFNLKTLPMPTLPCSFEAALLGINQSSFGPSTAAATDAAGATAPPVPPGFPAADPAEAMGPHAGGGGHLPATTATPAATPAVTVTPVTPATTPAPVTAPGAPIPRPFLGAAELVMATGIDPAAGRPIAAIGVDQVGPAASPAAAVAASGINVPTMTHPLIRATVLNPYATSTQDGAMTDAPTANLAQRTSPSPHYVEAGSRSTFYAHCKIWFQTCFLDAITAFENTVYERDKELRIAKAICSPWS